MLSQSATKRDSLATLGLVALLMSAATLPFELRDPIFKLGPLGITSVEIGLYLTIGIWGLAWLAGHRRAWTIMHTAIAAFSAVVILSALLAPSHHAETIKFAFRSLGGCILCFAVADFVRTPQSAALVSLALLAGSVLSAYAAQAEQWIPGAAAFLGYFKTAPSMVSGHLRASATFQYANIASMYWETTLPLALVVPLWWSRRRIGKVWWGTGLVCALLLLNAILLSSSRAGLVVAILILLALSAISKGENSPLRALAVGTALILLLLIVVYGVTSSVFFLRMTTGDASAWYRAEYADYPQQLTLMASRTARIPLSIRNRGKITWHAHGSKAIKVSYHWLDPTAETVLIWRGTDSEIPSDVEPGQAVAMQPWIVAPGKPGSYMLQWDMLQEKAFWFSVFGSSQARIKVQVLPSAGAAADLDYPRINWPLPLEPTRMDLWRAAIRMWRQRPLFGVGPDNFRRLYGDYLGLKSFDDRIYSNNLYLEMLANTGIIGFLAFLAVLAAFSFRFRKAWISAGRPVDRWLTIGLGIALSAHCLHGMVDYFMAFSPTYGQFWILAGMILGLSRGDASE